MFYMVYMNENGSTVRMQVETINRAIEFAELAAKSHPYVQVGSLPFGPMFDQWVNGTKVDVLLDPLKV